MRSLLKKKREKILASRNVKNFLTPSKNGVPLDGVKN